MKGRERGRGETDRVFAVGDAEGAELRVLLGDHAGRGRLVEELACEIAGERDEWDPGVLRDGGRELEQP